MKKITKKFMNEAAKTIISEVGFMSSVNVGELSAGFAAQEGDDTLFVRLNDDGKVEFGTGVREYGPCGGGARTNGWRELGWVAEFDEGTQLFETFEGETFEFKGEPSDKILTKASAMRLVEIGVGLVEFDND